MGGEAPAGGGLNRAAMIGGGAGRRKGKPVHGHGWTGRDAALKGGA
jgi:hypothetical protein